MRRRSHKTQVHTTDHPAGQASRECLPSRAVELIVVERHDEADIERRESWRSVAEHRLADSVHEIEQRKAHAEVDARGGRAVDELRRAKSEAVVGVDVEAQHDLAADAKRGGERRLGDGHGR